LAARGSQAQSAQIRQFILEAIAGHPSDITGQVAKNFGISRQAAHKHVRKLVDDGALVAYGETRDRHYELKPIAAHAFRVTLKPKVQEDVVWREKVRPLLSNVAPNVLGICEYGFTEILNNAIEHSVGTRADVSIRYALDAIDITVSDNGIGIFKKIQSEFHLDDERHAILELAKGKLTTDPAHHTGEGIFFTSRAFDRFAILSGKLRFSHAELGDDWLLEEEEALKGTSVSLRIHPKAKRRLQDVFDKYASGQNDYGFTRTRVPVALARYGDENLISRSQARRLLAGFDRFKEVLLDFKGVAVIGQAFADEVFRVFQAQNPNVQISWANANEQVKKMILHAGGNQ